ncbi:hypothetical protein Ancab_015780, partial [Ancistrocladus abbreviatus]
MEEATKAAARGFAGGSMQSFFGPNGKPALEEHQSKGNMEKPDLGDRVDSEDPKALELGSSAEKRSPKLKLFGVEINCSGEAAESGNATTAFNLIREEQNEKPLPRSKSLSLTVSPPSSEMLSGAGAFAIIETQEEEEEANRVRKGKRVLSDVKRTNNKNHYSSSWTRSAT